jgi:hypothetical protein
MPHLSAPQKLWAAWLCSWPRDPCNRICIVTQDFFLKTSKIENRRQKLKGTKSNCTWHTRLRISIRNSYVLLNGHQGLNHSTNCNTCSGLACYCSENVIFLTQKVVAHDPGEVNFVVSSLIMYNMWCLLWDMLYQNDNLTLGNGTYYICVMCVNT